MGLFAKNVPIARSKRDGGLEEDIRENKKNDYFSSIYLLFFGFFGLCLAICLSYAFQAGRLVEYRVPLLLMEPKLGTILTSTCILLLGASAAAAMQKTFISGFTDKPLNAAQSTSYFFSVLTTLVVAVYLCTSVAYMLQSNKFIFETMFIFIIYIAVLIPYFRRGKTKSAHVFISFSFIMVLFITAFYAGLGSARMERKVIVMIKGETFVLCASQNKNYILAGYEKFRKKTNGNVVLLPKDSSALNSMIFTSAIGH